MRHVAIGSAAFLAVGVSPLLVLAAQQEPRTGEPVLVVAAPWRTDASDVITKSGLREISPERAPLGALTVLSTAADARRLRENGALFVIDGAVIAQICAE